MSEKDSTKVKQVQQRSLLLQKLDLRTYFSDRHSFLDKVSNPLRISLLFFLPVVATKYMPSMGPIAIQSFIKEWMFEIPLRTVVDIFASTLRFSQDLKYKKSWIKYIRRASTYSKISKIISILSKYYEHLIGLLSSFNRD